MRLAIVAYSTMAEVGQSTVTPLDGVEIRGVLLGCVWHDVPPTSRVHFWGRSRARGKWYHAHPVAYRMVCPASH